MFFEKHNFYFYHIDNNKNKKMPIYLQDLSINVSFFFVLIASLMVVSMPNKWYYFLLVPLVFCLWGVFRLHGYSQTTKMYMEDIILTVVFLTMLVSAGLHADTDNRFQVILRGLVLVLMAFLSFLICFSSSMKSVYMRLLGFLFVFCLFIFCLTFIINDEPVLRKGLYWASIGIMLFFMFYYWMSMTVHLRQEKRKPQQKAITAWQFRQLPTKDGLRSRYIA